MSFGLKISFGRLCRLEKQRKKEFGIQESDMQIKTNNFIDDNMKNYDSTTCCDTITTIQPTAIDYSFYHEFELLRKSIINIICGVSVNE